MKNFLIVESPTKAKTISKFLGKEYVVASSYGHVRDLPKSEFGVDAERDFEPKYVIPAKARKIVAALKKEAAKSETVILATDEDREGEAIAWHLSEALGLGNLKSQISNLKQTPNPKPRIQKVERIVFHEITKGAIEEALKHPRGIDRQLVDAQQARRVLDRIVGYKLSPFLWKKVAGKLSAGRVQSVAVRLIADRENEIRNFKAEEYWTIIALLLPHSGGETFEAGLVKIGEETLDRLAIKNEAEAKRIAGELEQSNFVVLGIDRRKIRKNPPAPFITSTLQQEAVKRLGFSAKKTMLLAQRLYENGFITYMRTDSVNLSRESLAAAKDWIAANLGAKYAEEAPRVFTSKSKLAQEAHEAVRPTRIEETADQNSLTDAGEKKLYRLIWQRFIASQLPAAQIAATSVDVGVSPKGTTPPSPAYTLRASGQEIVFDGYLKVWPQKLVERTLPSLQEKDELSLKEIQPAQHFTEPPPRYSEASLIKTLEKYGIGRPSTYAPIISVIQLRNYVFKEQGRFKPTEIGELVNKVLTEHFPEIVDIDFTAKVEEKLDGIANGAAEWRGVIGDFYVPFAARLAEKYEEVSKKDIVADQATDEVCEKCGKPMVIKFGRFGKFMACSGFPECKNTKRLGGANGEKAAPKPIGMKCPKCGEGEVVERRVNRGRARGKIFWGCGRYPKCDYAVWENPMKPQAAKEEKESPEP